MEFRLLNIMKELTHLMSEGDLKMYEKLDQHAPWYTECWFVEDILDAMVAAGIDITRENCEKAEQAVKGIFDDKTERNEALKQCIENAFK